MEQELMELRKVQLEILRTMDRFCTAHGLRYSLYAGTALGAVRHGGFIPWDDDIDLCMPREDYDRFLRLWQAAPPEGYILQNKDTQPRFTQTFTKIRRDHTTFLQDAAEAGKYHTGIFVDIFPTDRMPDKGWQRLAFRWNCMQYLLLTREFVPPKGSLPEKLISGALLALTPPARRGVRRQKLLKKLTVHNADTALNVVTTETIGALSQLQPQDLWERLERREFAGEQVSCFVRWDDHLRAKYGEYMQLPPEEERVWTHHPICIDTRRNYEELSADE